MGAPDGDGLSAVFSGEAFAKAEDQLPNPCTKMSRECGNAIPDV
jgi:hypothetical protein